MKISDIPLFQKKLILPALPFLWQMSELPTPYGTELECYGIGKKTKRHNRSYHSKNCKEDKIFHQRHESFTVEVPLI